MLNSLALDLAKTMCEVKVGDGVVGRGGGLGRRGGGLGRRGGSEDASKHRVRRHWTPLVTVKDQYSHLVVYLNICIK